MKNAIRGGKMINLLKPFFLSVVLTFFGTVVLADTKYIRCTYLLEPWKINDLAGKRNCPFGVDGLGKPWLVETFSLDLSSGSVSDAKVIREYCHLDPQIASVKLYIQPDKLVYSEKRESEVERSVLGEYKTHVIDRQTLKKANNEAQCELVVAGKNKI